MYNPELTSQIESEYAFESSYLRAEKEHSIEQVSIEIFTKKVTKISRREAKGHYLYRRLDGKFKLI